MRNNKAFTLAELLIAMLIFSLLAVILVPNVTANAEKELFATQLKKVQNDVQQALLVMLTQNQGSLRLMCPGGGADSNDCFVKEIGKILEKNVEYSNAVANDIIPPCGDDDSGKKKDDKVQACGFKARKPIYLNKENAQLIVNGGNDWAGAFNAVNLKNGASVATVFDPNCNKATNASGTKITDWEIDDVVDTDGIKPANICGYIEIDVNAGKLPNVVGKDIHYFWIVDQDGIVPFGEVDLFTCGEIGTGANKGKIVTNPKDITSGANFLYKQLGCTARIMKRGKIDYY